MKMIDVCIGIWLIVLIAAAMQHAGLAIFQVIMTLVILYLNSKQPPTGKSP